MLRGTSPLLACCAALFVGCGASQSGKGTPERGEQAAATGRCGGFEQRELGAQKHDLLRNRLSIRVPDGSAESARPHDIMAAPHPDESETRLYLEESGKKLVVFSEELFARPGKDFMAAVRGSDPRLADARFQPIRLDSGLHAVLAVHSKLEAPAEAVPVAHAYTTLPDDTVQVTRIFVNREVVEDGADGCAALAERVLRSIEPGARRLELGAGQRKLGDRYTIDVPASFAVVAQPGPDFEVFRVQAVRALDAQPAVLGVYFGGHPNFAPDPNARKTATQLLSTATEWHEATANGLIHREALVKLESEYAHLFLAAVSSQDADELVRIAETLRPKS